MEGKGGKHSAVVRGHILLLRIEFIATVKTAM